MSEEEFLTHKAEYVADVIDILNRRAEDEAVLIFRRVEKHPEQLYTEVSNAISTEINEHYSRLFRFFQDNPQLCEKPLYRAAILRHLPRLIGKTEQFSSRIDGLPEKIKYAILASEIASSMVYKSNDDVPFVEIVESHLQQMAS